MAKKFYGVVLSDNKSGVFNNWADAKAFIDTCPSSAKYKSWPSAELAQNYVQTVLNNVLAVDANTTNPEADNNDVSPEHAIAFVDGSFNPHTNKWGYGIVFFRSDDKSNIQTVNGCGDAYAEVRNVAGELSAAMRAVTMAIKAGCKRLTIYCDYEGIINWATGGWKAKSEAAKKYQTWMAEKSKLIEIRFGHSMGHTGVQYNEMADVLAKQGCGVE